MPQEKTVCVDLDGTIIHYEEWKGEDHFGSPICGAKEAIEAMKAWGWKIIIFTTRGDSEKIANFLKSSNIPFDEINSNQDQPKNAKGGKVLADIYIDDRAITFDGDWKKILSKAQEFVPWEIKKKEESDQEKNEAAITFLSNDFNECFSQLRHYDSMMWDVTKFVLAELLGILVATWTIFCFGIDSKIAFVKENYLYVVVGILFVGYLFGILVVITLSRLRLYFTVVAKYINEHRNFFLGVKPLGFENESGMYMDFKNPRPFDLPSFHIISIHIVSALNSILVGLLFFCITHLFEFSRYDQFLLSLLAFFASTLIFIYLSRRFLQKKDGLRADEAVFHEEKNIKTQLTKTNQNCVATSTK